MNFYSNGDPAPDAMVCGVCWKRFPAEFAEKAVRHVLGHELKPEEMALLEKAGEC